MLPKHKLGLRLAMWSGPRNISTAMMRAWENRQDTVVWDEPLYAYFLEQTGANHPSAIEIISTGEPDWLTVVDQITGKIPNGKPIYFQKHMTHHLLEYECWEWLGQLSNCFLIRDPRQVIASYVKIRSDTTAFDLGIPQQAKIFQYVREMTGKTPPVLDAQDVLLNPCTQLRKLCEALHVPFSKNMLAWPPGPRRSDGVWAKHWYDSVQKSTGFIKYEPKPSTLPAHLKMLADECMVHYDMLHNFKL